MCRVYIFDLDIILLRHEWYVRPEATSNDRYSYLSDSLRLIFLNASVIGPPIVCVSEANKYCQSVGVQVSAVANWPARQNDAVDRASRSLR